MKEKAKKEKRYFCDCVSLFLEQYGRFIKWVVLILCIISSIITYRVISTKYAYQLDAYSEEDYNYLSQVAESFWDKDNKTLSLAKKPKDVNVEFDKSYNNGVEITLTKDIDYLFAKWPTVYIEISKDFDTFTIRPLSKEAFIRYTKTQMILLSIPLGFVVIIVPFFIIFLIGCAMYIISSIHKKLVKKKKPKNS